MVENYEITVVAGEITEMAERSSTSNKPLCSCLKDSFLKKEKKRNRGCCVSEDWTISHRVSMQWSRLRVGYLNKTLCDKKRRKQVKLEVGC